MLASRRLWQVIALLAVPTAISAERYDLVVFSATPAGIMASVHAARKGHTVALVEPTGRIGGLTTSGLSYTDFRTQEAVTGGFREYMDRVLAYYTRKYGADSPQVRDCFFGALAEPHVSLHVFNEMLREQPRIKLMTGSSLEGVAAGGGEEKTIQSIAVRHPSGVTDLEATIFIDASYEGDLAAAAGAPYRVGRESTREFGERLAGHIFFKDGRILQGSTGLGDQRVQSYNFRIIMTRRPDLRVMPPKPQGYDRSMFLRLLGHLQSGAIKRVFSEDRSGILRVQTIPNGKADINDIKNAPVRLSLPGSNDDYPEGDATVRQRIVDDHKRYNQGLLYFLQNDPEVPPRIRAEALEWGLPRDEFESTGHFPPRLYIREARRILGRYVFHEQDTFTAPGSVRAPLHTDSIAIGDYTLNCHGEQEPGPLHPTVTEGDFAFSTQPFQIPYGVILPRKVANLIVAVAVSATHVGFSAIRLEPTWSALGHAAGLAAHLAITGRTAPAAVDVGRLQALLHQTGAATIYFSDVSPAHPLFAAVQYFGTRGFFHSLVDPAKVELSPQVLRFGLQYSYAFKHHEARLDTPLSDKTRQQWLSMAPELRGCAIPGAASTRGAFLAELYRCASATPRPRQSMGVSPHDRNRATSTHP